MVPSDADTWTCVCGSTRRSPGFLDDVVYRTRWFEGEWRPAMFGGMSKRRNRNRYYVTGHRCEACGRVELFAREREV